MRYLFILLAAISLSACSYSPEQLQSSYNDLGKEYAKDIKQMADFSNEQQRQIDGFGSQIQQWHRQHKLPHYAALMTQLGTQLTQNGRIPQQNLSAFIDLLNGYPHFHEAREVNYRLGKLAQNLNDAQEAQIIAGMQSEQRGLTTHIRSQTNETRERSLVNMVDELSGYLGIELSKSQLDIARSFAPKYHDLGEASIAINQRWNTQLENLIRQRQTANFPQQFAQHMQRDNEYHLLLQREPQLVKANRQQAIMMLEALIDSLDEKQRKTLAATLLSIGDTFTKLAQ